MIDAGFQAVMHATLGYTMLAALLLLDDLVGGLLSLTGGVRAAS
jgi:hypothetical protein